MRRMTLGATEIDQETALRPLINLLNKNWVLKTTKQKETFEMWSGEMGTAQFRANQYDLFKHNCNNFTESVAQFLRELTLKFDLILIEHIDKSPS